MQGFSTRTFNNWSKEILKPLCYLKPHHKVEPKSNTPDGQEPEQRLDSPETQYKTKQYWE